MAWKSSRSAAAAGDPAPGRGRPGEGDLVHPRVADQQLGHLAIGGDHVEHARRQPDRLGRLGDQVAVSSSRWGTQIFLYAPSAGLADEAGQVAREVLARHGVGASVRTEFWSSLKEEWRDVTDEPSADPVAERRAAGRDMSRKVGFPAWQVRVDVRSHRDVVALAGYLAAQGWRVRRRRRHLLVGADCEDDAKGLVRELCGDGGADAETAFRVGRVSYSYMLFDASSTQVFGGGNG